MRVSQHWVKINSGCGLTSPPRPRPAAPAPAPPHPSPPHPAPPYPAPSRPAPPRPVPPHLTATHERLSTCVNTRCGCLVLVMASFSCTGVNVAYFIDILCGRRALFRAAVCGMPTGHARVEGVFDVYLRKGQGGDDGHAERQH